MKWFIAFIVGLTAVSALAWETIAPTTTWLHVHYRVPAEPSSPFVMRVTSADTTSWQFFKAQVSDEADHDMFSRNFVNLSIGHGSKYGERVDSTLTFPLYMDDRMNSGLSFRMSLVNPGRVRLEFGESEPLYTYFLDLNGKVLKFEILYGGKSRPVRQDMEIISSPEIQHCEFNTMRDLYCYLAQSTDPLEGLWTHYDQDSPSLRVSNKNRYTFAIVKSPGKGYEIVYLNASGGEIGPLWQPLAVKGRFYDIGLPDIYNLEWLDMNGRPSDSDATVQISGDRLLTIRLPYWDTTVRYVKTDLPK